MRLTRGRLRATAVGLCALAAGGETRKAAPASASEIPKTWDDAAMASMELPLAEPAASPKQVSAEYYYRIPVRPIYKSYPVFAPGREPAGYREWLERQEPETVFDASRRETRQDWIRAGELVFEAPIFYDAMVRAGDVRDPAWYDDVAPPVAKDGTLPFFRYVVREKGRVELGTISCAMCHTRVTGDGTVIKGAQGNFATPGSCGAGVVTRAVKGHPFGLSLTPDDRRALVAYLRTQ